MTGNPPLLAIVIFGASILSLMLTACGGPTASLPLPENPQVGDVLLEPCQVGKRKADCGRLIVPENPAKADSRLIALPLTRIHATGGDAAEPIFFFDGGPGEALNTRFEPPAALLAGHDVVLVGYRGVDGSSPLDCPEVTQAMYGVGGNLLSEASRANLTTARARCAQRLQHTGVDLSGYTLPNVVADLEAARAGLNYPQINLLARGYGTRIAELYADRYPDRVFRSAVIGPATPGHSMVFEPEMIDAQIEYYARLCAQDAGCSSRTSDLAATMRTVTRHLPERWLLFPIDAGKVRVATFLLLKRTQNAATVFDAYLAAEDGDPSGLLTIQTLYDIEVPVTWTAWGDFYAKNGIDYDTSRNYAADMDLGDSILGSPFSLLVWSGDLGWPMTVVPDEYRRLHRSDVRTLLVTGSVDTRFPPEYVTKELLPHLTNVQQVVVAEAGHELLDVQRPAVERLLASFFDTGVGDDSLYTYVPVNFAATSNAPALAKLALGGLGLMVIVISGVTWLIVRRVRRRRSISSPISGPGAGAARQREECMSSKNELANETRKADVNLHRFISDERWQRIHDDSARDYQSGEWVREKLLGVGRRRRELFSLATGSVLDVACGYGSNFAYLGNAAHITGVDVSPVMLGMAREHARRLNLAVDLRQGDVEHLDFPDHTFDTVISALATCSYLNPIAALHEMKRVCKPAGQLLLLEHGRSTWGLIGGFQDRSVVSSIERGGCRHNQEPQQIIQAAGLKINSAQRGFIGILHAIQVSPT